MTSTTDGVSSLSNDDIPTPPPLSPPVVEAMAMMAGSDVDVGGNTGGGTTTVESICVAEE